MSQFQTRTSRYSVSRCTGILPRLLIRWTNSSVDARYVVPAALTTTPVSDNGSLAVYTTGRDAFSVMMQATDAPCWLQVRAGLGGPMLFEGTLQPGEARPFDATRALWVRLGNLGHANVTVDGTPLVLPNKPSFPYNLLIQA